ncbi:MAG: DUF2752 domain-containing protein [Kiritimatiellae bacterium]|jgi:hypothetical protein|nr:DUF2752 domain-containing protein [Kiritimatiellia bacterium]
MKSITLVVPPLSQRRDERFLAWVGCPLLMLAGAAWPWIDGLLSIPVCRFNTSTGTPCWFCGGTRAASQLLQGNWRASLNAHPLVLPSLVLFLILWAYLLAASSIQRVPVLRKKLFYTQ